MTSDEAIEQAEALLQITPSSLVEATQISHRVTAYATLALALQEKERIDAKIAMDAQGREPFTIPMRGM